MAMTPKSFCTRFLGDTEIAGTLAIAAPRALYAVTFGPKAKKTPAKASAAFGGRLRLWYTVEKDRRWEDRHH
jgi:hypothetical protein